MRTGRSVGVRGAVRLAVAGVAALASTGTALVDVTPSGAPGAGATSAVAMSGDGHVVAFVTTAADLVVLPTGRPADVNSAPDVYVRDVMTRTTVLVSRTAAGTPGDRDSARFGPVALSADGRFVAFSSEAGDLVPGAAPLARQIYVEDLASGALELVSRSATGEPGDEDSGYYGLALSHDGRWVAFLSGAGNLDPLDTNGVTDVFVADRTTHRLRVVARRPSGAPGGSDTPADVLVRDRGTGETVTVTAGADASSTAGATLSADGTHVGFVSPATTLVAGDTNALPDAFVADLAH